MLRTVTPRLDRHHEGFGDNSRYMPSASIVQQKSDSAIERPLIQVSNDLLFPV